MEREHADKLSVILIGTGIILLLLTQFDVLPGKHEALIFGGIVCLLSGFLVKQLPGSGQ